MTDIVVARGMSATGTEINSRKKRALPGTFTTETCRDAAVARNGVAFVVEGPSDSSVTCTVYSTLGFITLSATSTLYYNTSVVSKYEEPFATRLKSLYQFDEKWLLQCIRKLFKWSINTGNIFAQSLGLKWFKLSFSWRVSLILSLLDDAGWTIVENCLSASSLTRDQIETDFSMTPDNAYERKQACRWDFNSVDCPKLTQYG